MPKVTIEITDILEEGTCPAGHKIGETFKYPEDVGKLCPAALNLPSGIKFHLSLHQSDGIGRIIPLLRGTQRPFCLLPRLQAPGSLQDLTITRI